MEKTLLTSKTFWFNVIAALVAVLAMPEVVQLIPATWLPYIAAVAAIGNMILRYITTEPVKPQ